MDARDDREQRLKDLFVAARRVDRESAPEFSTVSGRRRARRVRWTTSRRALAFGAAAAAAGIVLAAAALWEIERQAPESGPGPIVIRSYPSPDLTAAATPPRPDAQLGASSPPPARGIDVLSELPPALAPSSGNAVESRPGESSRPAPSPSNDRPPERSRNAAVAGTEALRTLGYVASAESPAGPRGDDSESGSAGAVAPAAVPLPGSASGTPVDIGAKSDPADAGPHGARSRDFRVTVGGVSNVDPLSGRYMTGNADAVAAVQRAPSGAGAELERKQGSFTVVVRTSDIADEDPAGFNTERYDQVEETGFVSPEDEPLSTFSIDVDTASYANVRRFLLAGRLPPKGAVRVEELLNYFDYDYPPPTGQAPFSINVDVAGCPWNPEHRLARIGLRGREVRRGETRGSNLVFLIDVSGSMQSADKLPLLQSALALLAEQLDGRDQVAVVVYAGAAGVVLESTPGSDTAAIRDAIASLSAGGSTNGGEGIRAAYRIARENFIPGGVNRVILATDGDFNLGVTSEGELLDLVREDARNGIFLTALGVGTGNYQDATLEALADRGNGNYHYLDSLREAQKVLVDQIGGTLVTIAKDVKIQVEFNPAEVAAYRLVGYDNRRLANPDFNDDTKDAGEIGAGHTVTALYEIVPAADGADLPGVPRVDALRYRRPTERTAAADTGELLTVKVRYKEPEGRKSRLLVQSVVDEGLTIEAASADFRFAAAVAEFGMLLRDSEHRGGADLAALPERVLDAVGPDKGGLRAEFLDLVRRATAARGAD